MMSKIIRGVVIGSAIGAAVAVAECQMHRGGMKLKFGKKVMKAIGL